MDDSSAVCPYCSRKIDTCMGSPCEQMHKELDESSGRAMFALQNKEPRKPRRATGTPLASIRGEAAPKTPAEVNRLIEECVRQHREKGGR